MNVLLVAFLFITGGNHLVTCIEEVRLEVEQGFIQGTKKVVLGSPVEIFLGVPFAEPPDGDNRFRPPIQKKPWSGVKPATSKAPACMQDKDRAFPGFEGAEMWNANDHAILENCLFLNIWAPSNVSSLATMVWIYGGGFFYGSPSLPLYDGEALAATGGVIVVNINYRVGPFGFLYLDHPDAPGNMGLLDQQLALRWIKANIRYFGGDPGKVTIFGESAGAASVAAHLIAPGSRDLYRYAIMQSGSLLNPWAVMTHSKVRNNSEALARRVGCPDSRTASSDEIIKCLKKVDPGTITRHYMKIPMGFLEFPFVPVPEDRNFFTKESRKAAKSGDVKKTNVMIGINSDEGSFWLVYYLANYFESKGQSLITRDQFTKCANKSFAHFPGHFWKAVAYEYGVLSLCDPQDLSPGTKFRDATNHMIGDAYFGCDVLDFARLLRDKMEDSRSIYSYYFDQRVTNNPWPTWMGTMHAYEIPYIFGAPLVTPSDYTPEEVEFSRQIIRFWTNFAKTGHPADVEYWPPMSHQNECRVLSGRTSSIVENLKKDKCDFWRDIKKFVSSPDYHEVSSGISLQGWSLALILCLSVPVLLIL